MMGRNWAARTADEWVDARAVQWDVDSAAQTVWTSGVNWAVLTAACSDVNWAGRWGSTMVAWTAGSTGRAVAGAMSKCPSSSVR